VLCVSAGLHDVNWEAIGAIGELVGGVAVIVTLIYLAIQVRQSKTLLERNEKIALSQMYQARADARMSQVIAQAQSGKAELIASIWGRPDLIDGLEGEDREIVRQYMIATMVHQDNILYQAKLGLLDAETSDLYKLIATNVPVWKKLDIGLTTLVKECYDNENESCGDA
jgi:hypothetical protein